MKRKGIDIVNVKELNIKDLCPNGEPGRITCYTETAIKEIGERFK
jgi:ribosomal protein L4